MRGVFLAFTPNGKIVLWNQKLERVTGYSGEEIEEMVPFDLINEEAGQVEEQLKTASEDGHTKTQFVSDLKRKGRGRIPYVFTASLLRMNEEKVICLGGQTLPEGEQLGGLEGNLKESQWRYRRLYEDAQEGIAITTPDGQILDANPAAREIFGYDQEEIPTLTTSDLYADPKDQEDVFEQLRREGALSGREVRFERADGEEIVCEISVTVQRTEAGKPVTLLTFFRDVTERKKAEEALKESEEKFRKLAEGAHVGITLIQDGVYEYVNPAMTRITGYSQEELIGASPKISAHPKDWPQIKEHIERRVEGEAQEVRYETRVQTKFGETRYVDVSGCRITYQGRPAVIATALDVTEEKRLRREFLQVQEEERRRIGQDLHDSIASQLTGVSLILGNLSTEPEAKEEGEDIEKAQALIKESANEMRRLSRGLSPGGLSEGDLFSALEGLAESTKGIRFECKEVEVERKVLDLQEETATHLYRITQEAVTNARRHGEADIIIIRLKKENGTLLLEVEDEGKGFDPGETSEGLGQRSMRHRADFLGAELEIESSPGEGTLVRCGLSV